MRALRERLAREQGFTLVELLVAMSVGTIVIMAAFMTLDRSVTLSNEVADRADALQRGRHGLEMITRVLRSQVCLGQATEPITEGLPTTVSFYADTSDGSRNPEKRSITYAQNPVTKRYELIERRYTGTGTYPDLVFSGYPGSPNSTRLLAMGVKAVQVSGVDQPIFRYYAFKEGGAPGELEQLPTPLSTDDVARTVMVRIRFVAQPLRTKIRNQDSVTLENDAYVRSADPSKPKEGAKCL
jgi:prepilin-type N-terminal cleavage/methylation domain-containing protein